jgi:hypothetical protein
MSSIKDYFLCKVKQFQRYMLVIFDQLLLEDITIQDNM